MHRLARLVILTAVLVCALGSIALADGPVGADPRVNFPVDQLPASCTEPTSVVCLAASVALLDQARAGLGQGPYQLPADFSSLSPQIQQFILTNLDRIQYGLAPITGITAKLSQDAMGGVAYDTDPHPTDPNFDYWTANWAGGFENVVLAYEAWMYDDGPGSGNLDCSPRDASGCWGHRHDVLWSFDGTGPLAMGSAVGTDSSGTAGYAMVLGEGEAGSYRPAYTYTWSQALAAGAGGGLGTQSDASLGGGRASGSHSATSMRTGNGSGARPAPPAAERVTVTVRGGGFIADQAGHSCHNTTCSFPETPGHVIRLIAHAAGHTAFAGWGGQCRGAAKICTLTSAGAGATVSASFRSVQARVSRRHNRRRAARVHARRVAH